MATPNNSLRFSLRSRTVPLCLEGVDGKVEDFEIREMTAAQRDAYLDQLGARIVKGENGENVIHNFEGMQAALLSRSLYRRVNNEKVSAEEIQGWPSTMVTEIFKEAQSVNKLNQEGLEEKKPLAAKGSAGSKLLPT